MFYNSEGFFSFIRIAAGLTFIMIIYYNIFGRSIVYNSFCQDVHFDVFSCSPSPFFIQYHPSWSFLFLFFYLLENKLQHSPLPLFYSILIFSFIFQFLFLSFFSSVFLLPSIIFCFFSQLLFISSPSYTFHLEGSLCNVNSLPTRHQSLSEADYESQWMSVVSDIM